MELRLAGFGKTEENFTQKKPRNLCSGITHRHTPAAPRARFGTAPNLSEVKIAKAAQNR
jgi:hypothetical protein